MKKALTVLIAIALFFSGFFTDREFFTQSPENSVTQKPVDCQFNYINPLRCNNELISNQTALAPLEKKIRQYIADQAAKGYAKDISVYYRDLHNGPVIGIHEDEEFTPASLLKIPVMIAYYKLAENNPDILQTKIGKDYEPSQASNVTDPSQTIQPHTEYTIEELIEKMLKYSDNNSKELLLLNLQKISPGSDLFVQTINDLGIIADTNRVDDFITVQAQASIFRILYNAAYLNNEMSEKALNLMSQSDFNDGLRQGVPDEITIAHKYGDRINANGEVQLHDCGIIYETNNNYLLCVMTRGSDIKTLSANVADISKMVYEATKK